MTQNLTLNGYINQVSGVTPVNSAVNGSNNTNYTPSPLTKPAEPDSFISGKKKTVLIAGAGIGVSAIAFILLAKKGKLGSTLQDFVNKIFKGKVAKGTVDAAQNVTNNEVATAIRKYSPPEIAQGPGEVTFHVQHNAKSVADDVSDWAALHKSMPKETDYVHNGKHLPINREFTEFEIKPHHYADDTDIFMCSRDYSHDFENYKIEDGFMKRIKGHVTDGIKEQGYARNFPFQNGSGIQTGAYDDGRKYVSFVMYNGEIVDTRPGYEVFTFASRNSEFTQTQKDIMKIFEKIGDKEFGANTYTPLTFATITPNLHPDKLGGLSSDGHIIRRTNRNALLSAISSWAEHLS